MTPLEELLETLDRASAPADPPFLVAAFGAARDGGVLVTDDDISHLLGWRVPSECWAVGLVGGGSPIPFDAANRERPRPPYPAEIDDDRSADVEGTDRVRLCCLVGRDGTVASLLRSPDGTVVASGDAEGRVIDGLRRTLGLPTPPPEEGTADLLAVLWMDALVDASKTGTRLTWPEAAALHPAMHALASDGHDIGLEHVTMIARVATAAWSWENLRLQACQDDWLSDLVPASLAEWMDEGMFSRWLSTNLPPVPSLSSPVAQVFDPQVWREVQAVIAATGAGGGGSGIKMRRGECQRRAAPEPAHRPRAMPRR